MEPPKNQCYSKEHPFLATIKERYALTREGSSKNTLHIVLDISGSGITYEVGDTVAVFPTNSSELVDRTLDVLQLSGEEKVTDEEVTLRHYLTHYANLTIPTRRLIQRHPDLQALTDPKAFIASHHVWQVLRDYPLSLSATDFVSLLSPLLPRFYSIASSPAVHPEELHLTVADIRYECRGIEKRGVCSHYLSDQTQAEISRVPIYLQSHRGFTLPADSSAPIIMIGPGTGIAPFRGFLYERIAKRAPGRNWLFFGERNQAFDFLYEEEWQRWAREGQLQLDVAFSRDQKEKIYVQHRMQEKAGELFRWIKEGAVIYVCGDAKQMAKDVEKTLLEIIEKEGNIEPVPYLRQMRKEKRYLRDVY